MEALIAYVTGHIGDLISVATAVVTAASAIANLTPSESDNKVVATISSVINKLALNLKK